MNPIAQFLADSKTFYLATTEGDQPRVRPFGAIAEWDGKTYFCCNNQKKVYHQMIANPKVEISAMAGPKWIRLEGKVALDPRPEAQAAMIAANPGLKNMYKPEDGLFAVFYFTEAKATVYAFNADPVEITF